MRLFEFGEVVQGYEIRVFNERELRAGAGIMFVGAMIAFMHALLIGNFLFLKAFVALFFVEFFIRLVINPTYAPVLILGKLATSNQQPEYSGAPQKRFAWGIGLAMSSVMFYLVVLNDVRGPVNFILCLMCLTFLFFEAAFGICLGCTFYHMFHKEKAKLCPGGACEIKRKHPIQMVSGLQMVLLVAFVVFGLWLLTSGIL